MKQFAFGTVGAMIKILYEETVTGEQIYYVGTGYAVKAPEVEASPSNEVFSFSFHRPLNSWDNKSKISIVSKFSLALINESYSYVEECIVLGMQHHELMTVQLN